MRTFQGIHLSADSTEAHLVTIPVRLDVFTIESEFTKCECGLRGPLTGEQIYGGGTKSYYWIYYHEPHSCVAIKEIDLLKTCKAQSNNIVLYGRQKTIIEITKGHGGAWIIKVGGDNRDQPLNCGREDLKFSKSLLKKPSVFSRISNGISNSISKYISNSISKGNAEK